MSALSGEAVLTRRGLYMLPTRFGWLFAAVLVVLLLASINYGNSLGYGLTFLLVGIGVVSMLSTDRNLLHLRIRAGASTPVFAGEAAIFRVHLINDGATPRYGIALAHKKQEVGRVDVAPGATATLELHVPAERRGWLVMPEFFIKTRFPLGILYSWSRRIALDERCLVYPKPSAPWSWRTEAETISHEGTRRTKSGDDFAGVREYRPGDSPRQIDWKSFARGRGLLTKDFAAGLSDTLWFDLERVPGPDVETRLSMLCYAIVDAEQSGCRYGLRLGSAEIAPDGGEAHQLRCLRALALYGQS